MTVTCDNCGEEVGPAAPLLEETRGVVIFQDEFFARVICARQNEHPTKRVVVWCRWRTFWFPWQAMAVSRYTFEVFVESRESSSDFVRSYSTTADHEQWRETATQLLGETERGGVVSALCPYDGAPVDRFDRAHGVVVREAIDAFDVLRERVQRRVDQETFEAALRLKGSA